MAKAAVLELLALMPILSLCYPQHAAQVGCEEIHLQNGIQWGATASMIQLDHSIYHTISGTSQELDMTGLMD